MAREAGVTVIEQYYTPEQLQYLERRRQALGDDAIQQAERDWAELAAAARDALAREVAPAAPEAQALAVRADALIAQFTGGDPGVAKSLARMYSEQGPEQASRGVWDSEIGDYVQRAREARATSEPPPWS